MVKTLHLQITNGVQTTRLIFARFPVRIGREAPCECVLEFPFVSKLHAQLELHGSSIVLRDEGSRNGTFVRARTERVPSEFLDLGPVGGEFQIGPLHFRAMLIGHDEGTVDLAATTQPTRAGEDILVDPEGVTKPGEEEPESHEEEEPESREETRSYDVKPRESSPLSRRESSTVA